MHSPSKDSEEPTSTSPPESQDAGSSSSSSTEASQTRPPAKRPFASTVIEISDTESDDSDVCAVNSYQASADEVKRIRGTEYSSSSSSSEYSSDSEESLEDDSILIEDKVQIKVVKKQLNPRAHRMDDPKFNPTLKSEELKTKLKSHWVEKKDYSNEDVTLTCDPFRLCLLHELLANEEIINNIVDDMNTMDWSRKKMDLYEFHQTTDLSNLTWQRSIRGIYELLKTEVMSWVSEVTGLQLTSVSASCSLYGPGDHLLVHDDLLADRRVAFILYLAPHEPPEPPPAPPPTAPPEAPNAAPPLAHCDAAELTNGDKQIAACGVQAAGEGAGEVAGEKAGEEAVEGACEEAGDGAGEGAGEEAERAGEGAGEEAERAGEGAGEEAGELGGVQEAALRARGWAAHMGGALELLAQDGAGRAGRVVRRVLPRNNMLAFFKVGHDSFHQVAEVLSLELPRLSINGWFHGPASSPARASPPPSSASALAPAPASAPALVAPHSEGPPLCQWVQASYLRPRVRAQVQAQMESASEVSLQELLLPAKYRELLAALDRPGARGVGAGGAGGAAALPARVGALGGGRGRRRGARPAAPGGQRPLPAAAGRLHRPAPGRPHAPRAAAVAPRGLHPAAGARGVRARAAGGAAVLRRGAPAQRRRHHLRQRGGGGWGCGGRAADGAAAQQRAEPGVLRRGRGRLHQVLRQAGRARRGPLLPAGRHVRGVTAAAALAHTHIYFY